MNQKIFTPARWHRWRPFIIGLGGLLLFACFFLFKIDSPAQLAPQELASVHANTSLRHIINNPLSLPFSLLQWGFLKLGPHNIAAVRLPAVIIAFAAVALFYNLVRHWHGRRIAIMVASLFAVSGWMLHIGRLAEPQILFLLTPLLLLGLGSWLNSTKRHSLAVPLLALVYGGLLFVPGAVWFELVMILFTAKSWGRHIKAANIWSLVGAGILLLACLGYLGYSLVTTPSLLRPWLGILDALPTPLTFLSQWGHSFSFMFIRGPYMPELWLAHAPIFSAFGAAMCVLGLYVYAKHFSNVRAHLLAAFVVVGSLLAALNGVQAQSFLIPTLYLLTAAGVAYLLHKWYIIFPKNPLGHGFGTIVVGVAIACACFYNLAAYFVAWQKSPDTKHTFTHQL